MAKITSGILGGFSGKIVNVIGYRRNGSNIIQSRQLKKETVLNTSLEANKNNLTSFWNIHGFYRSMYLLIFKTGWPTLKFYTSTYLSFAKQFVVASNSRKQGPVIQVDGDSKPLHCVMANTGDNDDNLTMTLSGFNQLRNRYGELKRRRIASLMTNGITTNETVVQTGNSFQQVLTSTFNPATKASQVSVQIFSTNGLYKSHIYSIYQKKVGTE